MLKRQTSADQRSLSPSSPFPSKPLKLKSSVSEGSPSLLALKGTSIGSSVDTLDTATLGGSSGTVGGRLVSTMMNSPRRMLEIRALEKKSQLLRKHQKQKHQQQQQQQQQLQKHHHHRRQQVTKSASTTPVEVVLPDSEISGLPPEIGPSLLRKISSKSQVVTGAATKSSSSGIAAAGSSSSLSSLRSKKKHKRKLPPRLRGKGIMVGRPALKTRAYSSSGSTAATPTKPLKHKRAVAGMVRSIATGMRSTGQSRRTTNITSATPPTMKAMFGPHHSRVGSLPSRPRGGSDQSGGKLPPMGTRLSQMKSASSIGLNPSIGRSTLAAAAAAQSSSQQHPSYAASIMIRDDVRKRREIRHRIEAQLKELGVKLQSERDIGIEHPTPVPGSVPFGSVKAAVASKRGHSSKKSKMKSRSAGALYSTLDSDSSDTDYDNVSGELDWLVHSKKQKKEEEEEVEKEEDQEKHEDHPESSFMPSSLLKIAQNFDEEEYVSSVSKKVKQRLKENLDTPVRCRTGHSVVSYEYLGNQTVRFLMKSRSSLDGLDSRDVLLALGDIILAGDYLGILRFLGPKVASSSSSSSSSDSDSFIFDSDDHRSAHSGRGLYMGLECMESVVGGHSGTVNGVRYFSCSTPQRTGILLPLSAYSKTISPMELLQSLQTQRCTAQLFRESAVELAKENQRLSAQYAGIKQLCRRLLSECKSGESQLERYGFIFGTAGAPHSAAQEVAVASLARKIDTLEKALKAKTMFPSVSAHAASVAIARGLAKTTSAERKTSKKLTPGKTAKPSSKVSSKSVSKPEMKKAGSAARSTSPPTTSPTESGHRRIYSQGKLSTVAESETRSTPPSEEGEKKKPSLAVIHSGLGTDSLETITVTPSLPKTPEISNPKTKDGESSSGSAKSRPHSVTTPDESSESATAKQVYFDGSYPTSTVEDPSAAAAAAAGMAALYQGHPMMMGMDPSHWYGHPSFYGAAGYPGGSYPSPYHPYDPYLPMPTMLHPSFSGGTHSGYSGFANPYEYNSMLMMNSMGYADPHWPGPMATPVSMSTPVEEITPFSSVSGGFPSVPTPQPPLSVRSRKKRKRKEKKTRDSLAEPQSSSETTVSARARRKQRKHTTAIHAKLKAMDSHDYYASQQPLGSPGLSSQLPLSLSRQMLKGVPSTNFEFKFRDHETPDDDDDDTVIERSEHGYSAFHQRLQLEHEDSGTVWGHGRPGSGMSYAIMSEAEAEEMMSQYGLDYDRISVMSMPFEQMEISPRDRPELGILDESKDEFDETEEDEEFGDAGSTYDITMPEGGFDPNSDDRPSMVYLEDESESDIELEPIDGDESDDMMGGLLFGEAANNSLGWSEPEDDGLASDF